MTLDDAKRTGAAISLETIASDTQLAREIQQRLIIAGLLDPPPDGMFGPVSQWALREFCNAKRLSFEVGSSSAIVSALQDDGIGNLFPLRPGSDLAGKIISAMQRSNYWIARHPQCFNIVYVEGMNPDGTPNDNAPNKFNALRTLVQVQPSGACKTAGLWEATTQPSKYWTEHPMDTKGAARIAFGQYKSWAVGIHHAGTASAHEALVQVADITVYRDSNKDYKREGPTYTGIFAVNQHWGYDLPENDLGTSSAGCLVGRLRNGHRAFMRAVKSDPRHVANTNYRFMTAVFPASDIR
jgi:hypothetical protein